MENAQTIKSTSNTFKNYILYMCRVKNRHSEIHKVKNIFYTEKYEQKSDILNIRNKKGY